MKVLRYEAHNVLRLSDIQFDMSGRNLFIVGGKNGQGKSSSLTALLMALCGRSGMDNYPEIALKQGESEGWVKVELTGDESVGEYSKLTVELYLKRKKRGDSQFTVEEFRILDSAGEEAPEPRTLLKQLYSTRAFDPLAFARLSPKDQKNTLAQLLGLDFTAEKERRQELYAERAIVNKTGVSKKAAFDAMPHFPEAPANPVSTGDLTSEWQRRVAINKSNADDRKELENLLKRAEGASRAVGVAEGEVVEAKRILAEAEERLRKLTQILDETQAEVLAKREMVASLTDENADEIVQQITSAEATNRKVEQNARRAQASQELAQLRSESERLTKDMESIDRAIAERIANAQWPVDGLGMDDEGLTFQGLPLSQACQSLKVRTSVKVGMALNPTLRLLVSETGGDLDTDTIAELDKILAEGDFQMLLEMVTRGPDDENLCAVIISDGQVRAAEGCQYDGAVS